MVPVSAAVWREGHEDPSQRLVVRACSSALPTPHHLSPGVAASDADPTTRQPLLIPMTRRPGRSTARSSPPTGSVG